jgi:hypothetical protein
MAYLAPLFPRRLFQPNADFGALALSVEQMSRVRRALQASEDQGDEEPAAALVAEHNAARERVLAPIEPIVVPTVAAGFAALMARGLAAGFDADTLLEMDAAHRALFAPPASKTSTPSALMVRRDALVRFVDQCIRMTMLVKAGAPPQVLTRDSEYLRELLVQLTEGELEPPQSEPPSIVDILEAAAPPFSDFGVGDLGEVLLEMEEFLADSDELAELLAATAPFDDGITALHPVPEEFHCSPLRHLLTRPPGVESVLKPYFPVPAVVLRPALAAGFDAAVIRIEAALAARRGELVLHVEQNLKEDFYPWYRGSEAWVDTALVRLRVFAEQVVQAAARGDYLALFDRES